MDRTELRPRPDSDSVIAAWRQRPAPRVGASAHALTVDVEDYFQVEAFARVIDRDSWPSRECRIEANVGRILDLFAAAGARGTFFTLAWIAERYPRLIRTIVDSGHELASHGTEHRRADHQSAEEFFGDVAHSKRVLEDISGRAVKGYRAPCVSLTRASLWLPEALARAGYRYSSSLYPIVHDAYGIPEAPRFAFHPLDGSDFLEIPVSSARLMGRNWPCGGGGYFRLLPYALNRMALDTVASRDRRPLVFYFHPWEIDPAQPRIAAPLKSRLRHYTNLATMEKKLARLLAAFRWRRMDEVFLGGAA